MELIEDSLLDALKTGDQAAYERIVRLYGDGVLGYLTKMTGCREKAEDYFQETFRRVFEKANTFSSGNFKSWVFRIATNVAMDGFRYAKRRPAFSLSEKMNESNSYEEQEMGTALIEEKASDPHREAVKTEMKEMVRKVISLLPPKQRTTLVLAYYQQLSYSQVAQIMGCSEGTVKRQMYAALKMLAKKLPGAAGE
jgi:RNA polymerase sigma-70 factor (ECF subfamily)